MGVRQRRAPYERIVEMAGKVSTRKNNQPKVDFILWFIRELRLIKEAIEANNKLTRRQKRFKDAFNTLLQIKAQDDGITTKKKMSFKFTHDNTEIDVKAYTLDEAKELYFTVFPNVLPVDVLVNGERIQ